MESWVPIMHIHHPNGEGKCAYKAFTPHGTEQGASDFWESLRGGIQFMVGTFNLPDMELQIVRAHCDHENYTTDCQPCTMWLDATVTDEADETERDSNAHSS